MTRPIHSIKFHSQTSEDLLTWYSEDLTLKIIDKTYCRLLISSEPDGRVVKRLHYIAVPIFFEYKVRRDLRAIFYKDERLFEIRILGYIRKNVTRKIFDKRLEFFLRRFYNFE